MYKEYVLLFVLDKKSYKFDKYDNFSPYILQIRQ